MTRGERRRAIEGGIKMSLYGGHVARVVEDKQTREFFRWEEGRLVEYDLTRARGRNIILTSEELQAVEEFDTVL